jgi:hypothetical protein
VEEERQIYGKHSMMVQTWVSESFSLSSGKFSHLNELKVNLIE